MSITKGDQVPDVQVMIASAEGPRPAQTAELFKGKKVALFAVPGAFTPTCSAQHLPNFVEKAAELKAKGCDEIICMSVNDAFVMNAWGESAQASEAVTMLADGNGAFTQALGLEMDGSGFGLGQRSQRFSAIIENGTVSELNIEAPGAYEVSSADYMLGQM